MTIKVTMLIQLCPGGYKMSLGCLVLDSKIPLWLTLAHAILSVVNDLAISLVLVIIIIPPRPPTRLHMLLQRIFQSLLWVANTTISVELEQGSLCQHHPGNILTVACAGDAPNFIITVCTTTHKRRVSNSTNTFQ